MRPLLALALVCLIMGSVQAFMVFQRAVAERRDQPTQNTVEPAAPQGDFRLRVSSPVALSPSTWLATPASIIVHRTGAKRVVARHTEPVDQGATVELVVADDQLHASDNAFVIELYPLDPYATWDGPAPAFNVQWLRGEQLLDSAELELQAEDDRLIATWKLRLAADAKKTPADAGGVHGVAP